MNLKQYPFNSLRRHMGRTCGLSALVAALSFAVLAGTIVIASLQNGLASLEARMGADILVAPKSASTTTNLEQVLIDGVPGYFYMDKSYVDKIAAVDGVQKLSPQYYLATIKAGCCSMPVQIIGIDPATDFTILPWIDHSYDKELSQGDVAVGANISGAIGSKILFYGRECTIVAKLDETGTALDNAAFCTADTIKELIQGSIEQNVAVLDDNDPDDIVSTILVKVDDEHDVRDVVNDINLHVHGVKAIQSKAMTSGVANSMAGVSNMIGVLVVAIWVLAVVVLTLAFVVLGRQRTKEFAVLRVVGVASRSLTRILMTESLLISAAGALVGIALAVLVTMGFAGAIESALGLPFLMPYVGTLVLLGMATLVMSLIVGTATSALAARRLARVDVSHILRDE